MYRSCCKYKVSSIYVEEFHKKREKKNISSISSRGCSKSRFSFFGQHCKANGRTNSNNHIISVTSQKCLSFGLSLSLFAQYQWKEIVYDCKFGFRSHYILGYLLCPSEREKRASSLFLHRLVLLSFQSFSGLALVILFSPFIQRLYLSCILYYVTLWF